LSGSWVSPMFVFFYSTYNPTYVLRQVFLYGIKKFILVLHRFQ
jgi:hypothetical protein